MSHSLSKLLIVAAAAVAAVGGVSKPTVGHALPIAVFALGDNDGIAVDKAAFKGKRSQAKARAQARIGPEEEFYMMYGVAPRYVPPQGHDLKQWCPQCTWVTPGSYAAPGK